ncbi:hypothetical protein, partial [Nocardia asiatica]|uniref:hypothetical protein n=1 Tax=Nocardia asiatica TaxID=209252 RepID=UPI002454C00A
RMGAQELDRADRDNAPTIAGSVPESRGGGAPPPAPRGGGRGGGRPARGGRGVGKGPPPPPRGPAGAPPLGGRPAVVTPVGCAGLSGC